MSATGLRRARHVCRLAAGLAALLVAGLASPAALAQPGAEPVADPAYATSPDCTLDAGIGVLATSGTKDAYLCVASDPGAPIALLAALDALQAAADTTDGPRNRYTRALTLWLLDHADATWDPALVRRLSPDDRRVLADGVHARRGRASPAPQHDAIFQNLPWYSPDTGYTDGRLTEDDKAKIALADKPPPPPQAPPAPPPPSDEGTTAPALADGEPSRCGCASGSGSGDSHIGRALAALAALGALVWRGRAGQATDRTRRSAATRNGAPVAART